MRSRPQHQSQTGQYLLQGSGGVGSGCGIWGVGYRIWGLGFGQYVGFEVRDSGCRVWDVSGFVTVDALCTLSCSSGVLLHLECCSIRVLLN